MTALAVDPPRYTLLETARYYVRDRLAADGELDAARGRMAATMLEVLDLAYEEYWSLDEAIWLHRYEPELDNVRAAMEWAAEHDRALGVALFGSAWPLFVETDLYGEGRARSRKRSLCSLMVCRAPGSGGSGKRSPPTIRRVNAIARATPRSSPLRCMPRRRIPAPTTTP